MSSESETPEREDGQKILICYMGSARRQGSRDPFRLEGGRSRVRQDCIAGFGAADGNGVFGGWFACEAAAGRGCVIDSGFVAAPNNLAVTLYGHIGLPLYKAAKYSHNSVSNARYYASNKIWECSRFGLPVVGSDVPGFASEFKDGGMGSRSMALLSLLPRLCEPLMRIASVTALTVASTANPSTLRRLTPRLLTRR